MISFKHRILVPQGFLVTTSGARVLIAPLVPSRKVESLFKLPIYRR